MNIINIREFKNFKNKIINKKDIVVLCHGVFDVIHIGHILHFQSAKRLGTKLIVSITPDEFVNKGPDRPYFSLEDRAKMISSFKFVDLVIKNDSATAENVLKTVKPNVFAKGQDYEDSSKDLTGNIKKELEIVKKNNGEIIFTQEKQYSSSNIINSYIEIDSESNIFIKKNKLNIERVKFYLSNLSKLKVILMGEVIIDEYNYVEVLAKSPKENVLSTRNENSEVFFGGIIATANIISNFVNRVSLICLIGNNLNKKKLSKKVNKNVSIIEINTNETETIRKKRFIQKSNLHKFFQIQYMPTNDLDEKQKNKIKSNLKRLIKSHHLLAINDFGHSLIDKDLCNFIDNLKIYKSINVQTNSSNYGFNLVTKYKKADYISIDLPEAQLAVSSKSKDCNFLAKEIYKNTKFKLISITQGHKGSSIHFKKSDIKIPAMVSRTIDTMGAGDSYFALTSILSYLKFDPMNIGFIGNCAGGIASNIRGHSSSITKKDLLRFIETKLK